MFTLTGSGIRNILFDARLHNPAQLPAQLTFCPAQFASKKSAQFSFFSHTLSEGQHECSLLYNAKNQKTFYSRTISRELP